MTRTPLRLTVLGADPDAPFPPAESALRNPDGLLATGGDLSPARLLNAYRHGIFPWFSKGQPILWWCPDSPKNPYDGVRNRGSMHRNTEEVLLCIFNAFANGLRHFAGFT